jgi:hypothetical protein
VGPRSTKAPSFTGKTGPQRSVLVGVLALVGCNFDPSGMGTAGPNLGGGDDPSGTGARAAATNKPTQGGEDGTDLDTTHGPTTDTTSDPTGGDPTGPPCMSECPAGWACVGGGCINVDEGEPCDMGCGPAAPYCAPDGLCHDGTAGDPCHEGQCMTPLLCGPAGTCQAGSEGEPCADAQDCSPSAPLCAGGACHDGSDGDPCVGDDDCTGLLCGPIGCQDGNEGDPCANDGDCAAGNYCPYDNQCHDGNPGDPCTDNAQCDWITSSCAWTPFGYFCSF